jgi:hypothetical protein
VARIEPEAAETLAQFLSRCLEVRVISGNELGRRIRPANHEDGKRLVRRWLSSDKDDDRTGRLTKPSAEELDAALDANFSGFVLGQPSRAHPAEALRSEIDEVKGRLASLEADVKGRLASVEADVHDLKQAPARKQRPKARSARRSPKVRATKSGRAA